MASTSASSIRKSFKYDVFLSFRGEDTRKNFVDHLYHALKQNGIYTYKDDQEIKKGKRISDELINSIQDSKIFIIVFSKNYASSSWCLDELVKIMECQRTNEHTAYPVFYDVEPTEIRKQSGVVREAFAKHANEEAAERWRDSLKQAADLVGWELKNTFDGHEAKFIEKIVEEISQELRFINPSVDENLIGMETRVEDVVSSLETDIYDVRMIGIKGMGGAGKTTLARVVFDQISFRFEGSSFVENVRENSKNLSCGLQLLQKQVLSDVLKTKDITVNGIYEGKILMKQRMCCKKVLVVLDDVDHVDQLEALAGDLSWFKPGSRIIITTREEQVLVAHGVPMNMILDVSLLSYEETNCLFNRYAFGSEVPKPSYKELSIRVVHYAAGHPLTIKVLGSFLRGRDELEWTDALERLKTIPLRETQEILEISYNGLEEDYKEIFLDVACILKGWHKERAIIALESCDLHARSGLRILEQKSLITISNNGQLGMHDHIEEMGKNIVRRSYPNAPYRHSRLWIGKEVNDILVEDRGVEATRCVINWKACKVKRLHLQKMKELRFLRVEGCNYKRSSDGIRLPNSLQYISWYDYPYKCLPKEFLGNNLVGLEIHSGSLRQLWKFGAKKVLNKLKFIDFHACYLRTFDIGLTMNLERLMLRSCYNLVKLRMPIESFKLKFLCIYECYQIRTLGLARAQNLETLEVVGCMDLIELHMPVENPKLKYLHLETCWGLNTLNLTRIQNIETLELIGCDNLVELHMPVKNFKLKSFICIGCKLSTLDLGWVENLDMLHIRKLKNLVEFHFAVKYVKTLRLAECFELKTINLKWTQSVESLNIFCCRNLEEILMPVESHGLQVQTIRIHCSTKLRTLNLTQTWNLMSLCLSDCNNLVELHMPIDQSAELKTDLSDCPNLRTLNLTSTRNLKSLILSKCKVLVELHMPIEGFKLEFVRIISCTLIRTLDLVRAQNLEALKVYDCDSLVELHIENPKLKYLKIKECPWLKTLNLTGYQNIEILKLEQCMALVELHFAIKNIKTLVVDGCYKLKTINLKWTRSLESLTISKCMDLVEILMPVESHDLKTIKVSFSKPRNLNLTSTRNLKYLYIAFCDDLELHMPIESPELKTHFISCSNMRTL